MKDIAQAALELVMAEIVRTVEIIREDSSENIRYWQRELQADLALKAKIERRFNVKQNVVLVDFSQRRKVA